MNILTIVFISFGLSMDTFAVASASGVTIKENRILSAIKMGLFFGGFQAIMPVIGWLTGAGMKEFISFIDHWIAFALLLFVGGKMIYESFKLKEKTDKQNPFQIWSLLLLSIATNIDALAIGLAFSFLSVSIVMPVIIIGLTTFCMSLIGVIIGNKIGRFFENKIEALGGVILILIGFKILLEHL